MPVYHQRRTAAHLPLACIPARSAVTGRSRAAGQWLPRAWAGLAVIVLIAGLAGCGEDEYGARRLHPGSNTPDLQKPTAQRSQDPLGLAADMPHAIGADQPLPGLSGAVTDVPNSGADDLSKRDLFWRLQYFQDKASEGRLPADTKAYLGKFRGQALRTHDDTAKVLILQVMDDLGDVVKAERDGAAMRRTLVPSAGVPWGAGRDAVEQGVRAQLAGVGEGSEQRAADPMVDEAARWAGEYEERHHSSPVLIREAAMGRVQSGMQRLTTVLGFEDSAKANHESNRYGASSGSSAGVPPSTPPGLR